MDGSAKLWLGVINMDVSEACVTAALIECKLLINYSINFSNFSRVSRDRCACIDSKCSICT